MQSFSGALVLYITTVQCQLHRENDRIIPGSPSRYVLPVIGLGNFEQQTSDLKDEEEIQYYKANRRSERIPAYQLEETEEDYSGQSQSSQKVASNDYSYQSTPSHKDYEQIIKATHLARLKAAAKKQSQFQERQLTRESRPQPVQQYLKEVNPTTRTVYERPTNYLRFNGASENPSYKRQDRIEESSQRAVSNPLTYRYNVLQPTELPQQQNIFTQYQYETQEPSKLVQPKQQPFNLVAYQNALLAQQKVLAEIEAQRQENSAPKPAAPVYAPPNSVKKSKNKYKPLVPNANSEQYEFITPQAETRPQAFHHETLLRYQPQHQLVDTRHIYQKPEESEDSESYGDHKDSEPYSPESQPTKQLQQRIKTTRTQSRVPSKYQIDEQPEDSRPQFKYQTENSALEYQQDPELQQQFLQKYQNQVVQSNKPIVRQPEVSSDEQPSQRALLQYQVPVTRYQPETVTKQPLVQYQRTEVRQVPTRYVTRQQYEESKHFPHYRQADLLYQPSGNVAVRYNPFSVSYRQNLPNSNVRYFRGMSASRSYAE